MTDKAWSRQRRHFYFLSGCAVPDCDLTYDIHNDHLTLFIPPIDPDSLILSGLPLSPAEALQLCDVDAVQQSTEFECPSRRYTRPTHHLGDRGTGL